MWYRASSTVLISLMGVGRESLPPVPAAFFWGTAGSLMASSKEFHSPQLGHFPIHLADSNPHSRHW